MQGERQRSYPSQTTNRVGGSYPTISSNEWRREIIPNYFLLAGIATGKKTCDRERRGGNKTTLVED